MIGKTIKAVDYDNEDLHILFDDGTITHIGAGFCYDQPLLTVDHDMTPDPYVLCDLGVITEEEQNRIEKEKEEAYKIHAIKEKETSEKKELKRLKKKYE